MPTSPPSLRCAKLGVATAETATMTSTPAKYLFIRTMRRSPCRSPLEPRQRNRAEIVRGPALHRCKPASSASRERLQNCHPRLELVKRHHEKSRDRAPCIQWPRIAHCEDDLTALSIARIVMPN